jgi:hypothetical protein
MSLEQIKNDIGLRGYFFDLLSKNFVLGLTIEHSLKPEDYTRVHKEYYEAYQNLLKALQSRVKDEELFDVIQQVSLYYIGKIGRLKFIGTNLDPSNN